MSSEEHTALTISAVSQDAGTAWQPQDILTTCMLLLYLTQYYVLPVWVMTVHHQQFMMGEVEPWYLVAVLVATFGKFRLLPRTPHASSDSRSTLSSVHTQLQPCETKLLYSSVCLCVRLSVHLSVSLPIFLSLSICLLLVCRSVCLSVCLSVCGSQPCSSCMCLRLSIGHMCLCGFCIGGYAILELLFL